MFAHLISPRGQVAIIKRAYIKFLRVYWTAQSHSQSSTSSVYTAFSTNWGGERFEWRYTLVTCQTVKINRRCYCCIIRCCPNVHVDTNTPIISDYGLLHTLQPQTAAAVRNPNHQTLTHWHTSDSVHVRITALLPWLPIIQFVVSSTQKQRRGRASKHTACWSMTGRGNAWE